MRIGRAARRGRVAPGPPQAAATEARMVQGAAEPAAPADRGRLDLSPRTRRPLADHPRERVCRLSPSARSGRRRHQHQEDRPGPAHGGSKQVTKRLARVRPDLSPPVTHKLVDDGQPSARPGARHGVLRLDTPDLLQFRRIIAMPGLKQPSLGWRGSDKRVGGGSMTCMSQVVVARCAPCNCRERRRLAGVSNQEQGGRVPRQSVRAGL